MRKCPVERPWMKVKPVNRMFRREILKKCGPNAFLIPDPFKPQFPIVPKDSCCVSAIGLDAALKRAAQNMYPPEIMARGIQIAKKAGISGRVIQQKEETLKNRWNFYKQRALQRWGAGGYQELLKKAHVRTSAQFGQTRAELTPEGKRLLREYMARHTPRVVLSPIEKEARRLNIIEDKINRIKRMLKDPALNISAQKALKDELQNLYAEYRQITARTGLYGR